MRRLIIFGILMLIVCRFTFAEEKIYPCCKLDKEPILDGKVKDDPAWKDIPIATRFLELGTKSLSDKQTSFKIGYSAEGVYIGIECEEPEIEGVRAKGKDMDPLWKEDSIEIFIFPKGADDYYQFVVNAIGSRWNGIGHGNPKMPLGNWQTKSYKGENYYSIEIKLPWEIFHTLPKKGEEWHFNICRNIYTSGDDNEPTNWAYVDGGFHEPRNFAKIIFRAFSKEFSKEEVKKYCDALRPMYKHGYEVKIPKAHIRMYEVPIGKVRGKVYAYVTLHSKGNPIQFTNGIPQCLQIITLGQMVDDKFIPAVRFGFGDDRYAGHAKARLVPWIFDGKFNWYGRFVPRNALHDFKLIIDLAQKTTTIWTNARGDDEWFMLADGVPLLGSVSAINHIRVEKYSLSDEIEGLVVQSKPWPEGEAVRADPMAKKGCVVGPGKGFKFQSMRSVWRKQGRHVTIARSNTRWMGFPDVVLTGPKTLVCCYVDGIAHGGGGGLFVCHSNDLGQTWNKAVRVHSNGANTSRLQILKDGTLLLLADVYPAFDVVLYDSHDGGKTWVNKRWCRAKEADGHNVSCPSHVLELKDGSWLMVSSWYPGMKPHEGTRGMRLEFYRSTDRGTTWKLYSYSEPWPPHCPDEVSLLHLADGRIVMYGRESGYTLPGIKAYSSDNGKTWRYQEWPYFVTGRICAHYLKDGRVMCTFRREKGLSGLWAWVGDVLDDTPFLIHAAHSKDKHTVGLKDGELHINNDCSYGQRTLYYLRSPDSPETSIDLTVEVKVLSDKGKVTMFSVPFVGEFRIFPGYITFLQEGSKINVTPGQFHAYRVVSSCKRMKLYVDGKQVLDTDKVDNRTVPMGWTPYKQSRHNLCFGSSGGHTAKGYSIWRRVKLIMDDPKTGRRVYSWSARDGFPDQYQLDHSIIIENSVSGWDQGYSGWVELPDGRIFVVNYTNDGVCKWRRKSAGCVGGSWIRGTYLLPSDLPEKEENGT